MSTTVDALLEKDPPCTLQELLQDPDILQECKSKNEKLANRLVQHENIKQMIEYVIRPDANLGTELCEKLALNSTEVLTCEQLDSVADYILNNGELMKLLLSLPERLSPLNPLFTSYWTRILSRLLARNVPEALDHIYSYDHFLDKLLNHTATSAVADFVMKLLSVEDLPGGRGIGRWLQDNGLVRALINQLDPFLNPEHHSTATFILLEMISISYSNAIGSEALESLANGEAGIWGTSAVEQYMATQTLAQLGQDKTLADESALVNELKSRTMVELLLKHMLASEAPYSTSTFANGTSIIIELIRKYCTEVEQCEFLHHQASQPQSDGSFPIRPPSTQRISALATYLTDLLDVLESHFAQLAALLKKTRSVSESVPYTHGTMRPLGPERYKACELFAEVLHLQYLVASSPLFDSFLKTKADLGLTEGSVTPVESPVAKADADSAVSRPVEMELKAPGKIFVVEKLVDLTLLFVREKVLPTSIELFFEYEWNNFLHSVVYDMIAKIANTYAYCTSSPCPEVPENLDMTGLSIEANERPTHFMAKLQRNIRLLVIDIFIAGKLTSRMCEAQRKNDFSVSQERGYRLGYMGHLTYIADEVLKLVEKCNEGDLESELGLLFESEEWVQYVQGPLKETKERDRLVLGGNRPDPNSGEASAGFLSDSIGGSLSFKEAGEGLAPSALSQLGIEFGKDFDTVPSEHGDAESSALLERGSDSSDDDDDDETGVSSEALKGTGENGEIGDLGKNLDEKLTLEKSLPSIPSMPVPASDPNVSPSAASVVSTGSNSSNVLCNISNVEEDQLGRYIVQSVVSSIPVEMAGGEHLAESSEHSEQQFPDWLAEKAGFIKVEKQQQPPADEALLENRASALQDSIEQPLTVADWNRTDYESNFNEGRTESESKVSPSVACPAENEC